MSELKPCAHCGGDADLLLDYVHCLKCGVQTAIHASQHKAVEVWNTRPTVQAPVTTEQLADWLRGYDSDRSATPENAAGKLAKFVGGQLAVVPQASTSGRVSAERVAEIAKRAEEAFPDRPSVAFAYIQGCIAREEAALRTAPKSLEVMPCP